MSFYFRSVAPLGLHTKLSSNLLSPPSFLSHASESLPCTISGEGEGKRQINKISFQSLYSQRELDDGGGGQGGRGGSAASN